MPAPAWWVTSVVVVVTVVLCSRDFVLLPAVDFGASRPERPRPVALRTSVRKPPRRPLGSLFPRLLPPAGVAARRAGASAVLVALRDRAVGVAFVRTMAAAGVARAAASTMATAMTTTTAAAMTSPPPPPPPPPLPPPSFARAPPVSNICVENETERGWRPSVTPRAKVETASIIRGCFEEGPACQMGKEAQPRRYPAPSCNGAKLKRHKTFGRWAQALGPC